MLVEAYPDDPLCVTLRVGAEEAWRIEDVPARIWDRKRKHWVMPILPNVPFFKSHLRANEFTDEAVAQIRAAIANNSSGAPWRLAYLGTPMAHQITAMKLAAGKDAFFFAHAMGCVSGDTVIQCLLWSGAGRKRTIEQLYNINREKCRVRVRCLKDNQFGQHGVKDIIYSGVKFTYTLTLSDGKSLRATKDHKVLTPDGWRTVGELMPGDDVMVNGDKPDKDGYVRRYRPDHPRAWKSAKVVYEHILIAEKLLGRYLEPNEVVHHKNGIKHDNRPENIEVMSEFDHLSKAHGKQFRANLDGGISTVSGGRVVVVPKIVQVASVVPYGNEPTYDICMDDPYHNFVANGIVVHNSGKSLVILTLTCNLYLHEKLQGLLVVCPASIRRDVWEAEVNKWLPLSGINYSCHIVEPGSSNSTNKFIRSNDHGLKILVVSVQSLSDANGKAYQAAAEFLTNTRCAMVVDECSKLKSVSAKRTTNAIELGNLACWRWAATGTKITQGVHDIYSQFQYLDWRILGHKSFYTFRNRYCVMGGFEGKKIVGYRNLPQLLELVKPYVHEVRKEDANQLPPKIYLKRHVEASAEQQKLYAQLRTELMAEAGGDTLTVKNTLERLVRYAQLAGGNFPYRNGEDWATKPLATNPKLAELLELLDDCDDKVIIWAVFVPEIRAIYDALTRTYGPGSAVAYYGAVDTTTRTGNIQQFKSDPNCRFFVANQQTAGMGLTLTEATLAVYYSNSFSLEDRLQSEDRCHRTGQTKSVTYIDLIINLPVDKLVQAALASKGNIASYVSNQLVSGVNVDQ